MKTLVKICGVRSLEAAKTAVDAGADFLGFNFVKTSKRYIAPEEAKGIIAALKGKAKMVGVFQNEEIVGINAIAYMLDLDYVQLHGDETPEYCTEMTLPVIRAISVPLDFDPVAVEQLMQTYTVAYFLIDKEKSSKGRLSLLSAKKLASKTPFFLAGGLDTQNIYRTVSFIEPFGVDVASGVETDGQQDMRKVKSFIITAKGVTL